MEISETIGNGSSSTVNNCIPTRYMFIIVVYDILAIAY